MADTGYTASIPPVTTGMPVVIKKSKAHAFYSKLSGKDWRSSGSYLLHERGPFHHVSLVIAGVLGECPPLYTLFPRFLFSGFG